MTAEQLAGHALVRVEELEACFTKLHSSVTLSEGKLALAEQMATVLVDQKFVALQSQITKMVASAEAKVEVAQTKADALIAASEARVASAEKAIEEKAAAHEARMAAAEQLIERRLAALERVIVVLQEETAAARAMAVEAQVQAQRRAGGTTTARPATVAELQQRLHAVEEFRASGQHCRMAKAAGYDCAEVRLAGYSATEAHEVGYTKEEITAAGYSKDWGPSATQHLQKLKASGFSCAEAKAGGYTLRESLNAGFTFVDAKAAGYVLEKTLDRLPSWLAGGVPGAGDANGVCFRHIDGTRADSRNQAHWSSLLSTIHDGYTLQEMRQAGYTRDHLGRIMLKELKEAGYTCHQAKLAGYTCYEIGAAGYRVKDAKKAGYTLEEIKDGYTATVAKAAGYTLAEMKAAGYVQGLKEAGFTVVELKAAGYNVKEAKLSYTLEELKAGGYSIAEFKTSGSMPFECKLAGFSFEEACAAGLSWDLERGKSYWDQVLISGMNRSDAVDWQGKRY